MVPRRFIPVLVFAFVVAGCSDGASDETPATPATTTSTLALVTTTPAAPATSLLEPDVAAAVAFIEAGSDEVMGYLDPDAMFRDGRVLVSLDRENDFFADWSGDGVSTNADKIAENALMGEVFLMAWDIECLREGREIVCTVEHTHPLAVHAGIPAYRYTQAFEVEDGLITVIGLAEYDEGTFDEHPVTIWAPFERWVAEGYPGLHDTLFSEPCCAGSLIWEPDTADTLGSLIAEWVVSS